MARLRGTKPTAPPHWGRQSPPLRSLAPPSTHYFHAGEHMNSLKLKFYEYAALQKGAALFICRADDPRLPQKLRDGVQFPCIITDDLARLMETLTLQRIAELWEEAAPFQRRQRDN